MNWYIAVLKNYSDFSGRARRTEYWIFFLVNVIISVVFGVLIVMTDGFLYVFLLYALAVLIPSLAVGVRRLHDTGRSGWWLLISLVPFVGAIILIYFFVLEGEPGDNVYGPNPKNAAPLH
ncbi:DUF805 domain-containing protein [Actinomadura sp. HBU206391]|uniref:DUF805 domain-containing protein n=1 Tax=Actinomadura sp. HBU206391 TaxID=2731692 RepID=UPI00164EE0C2|nr:DUF805 domain-containing protein [Actinomadura sp. HBU206391]MBC6460830.1 DUF805 domain-containing protein [Actinomadura sp. HBU206391]